jgi:diguanylate cyclase (GGDEF)-like protein
MTDHDRSRWGAVPPESRSEKSPPSAPAIKPGARVESIPVAETDASAGRADAVIMMVDDEPLNLEIIQAFLEDAGYRRFVPTSEPARAMELLAAHRPDVVLLDLMMPLVSGFDILGRVRADEVLRHVPVIVLTSSTEPETKLRALELGATDFLGKPVDPSELALRLRNTLSAKAYRDRLANYDSVTGLANRTLLTRRLDDALRHAAPTGRRGALVHVNLDRFKKINEALGLVVGDSVLRGVAIRLELALHASGSAAGGADGQGALLCRIGGDEFAVLLEDVGDPTRASAVAQAVLDSLAAPLRAAGEDVFLSASIGVAFFPGDGMATGELLTNSAVAMRHAKQDGGGSIRFYSRRLSERSLHRLSLETALRRAIEREELSLVYQPKVRTATGRGTGAEALLRWRHPEMGLVGPGAFIPLAEETGLIVPLGDWVLHATCAQVRRWRGAGLRVPRIAVNVASAQFRGQRLKAAVRAALEASRIDPTDLALELTETAMMEDAPRNSLMLRELKELGIRLAIDDFGTGYSSLSYLKRFPLDELKIDRSFVAGVDSDADSAAIVIAIIAMAHHLGLSVVAEGVETRSQLALLRRHGCDECQGFLFSRPLEEPDFARMLGGDSAPTAERAPDTPLPLASGVD